MLELLTIFAAGFVSVFALGFQSRNVNHGNYGWAAGTSFFVAISQGALWSHIVGSDVGILGWLTYGVSGMAAITSSMYVHQRWVKKESK